MAKAATIKIKLLSGCAQACGIQGNQDQVILSLFKIRAPKGAFFAFLGDACFLLQ